MGKVIPFVPKKPEQEIIYLEVLPEGETQSILYLKYLSDKGLIDSESTVQVYLKLVNRELR